MLDTAGNVINAGEASVRDAMGNLGFSTMLSRSHNGGALLASSVANAQGLPNAAPNAGGSAFMGEIGLPVNSARWGEQFAQRINWLVTQGIKSAEMQLNPAELGPIHVRIDSTDESARVVITTQNANTRDAIEQQSARLRSMFSDQGLDLADVDVSSDQQFDGDTGDKRDGDESSNVVEPTSELAQSTIASAGNGETDEISSNNSHRYDLVFEFRPVDTFA